MPADPTFRFEGFRLPNYTQTPNEFFDELAPKLTEAELRVLIYVIRRTFGFHKKAEAISLSQMTEGITTRDGRVLDIGTGMSRSAVWRGAKGLVEKGVIGVERVQSENGEYETNVYSLRFAEETEVSLQENHPPSFREQGVGVQERVQNKVPQNIVGKEPFEISKGAGRFEVRRGAAGAAGLRRGPRPELNDRAPLASTTTRLVNLFRASGLDLETFVTRLMQARAITQERTASIRGRGEGVGPKPKMAFFLAVVEDLTGREAS
jgi:hypothetical protein